MKKLFGLKDLLKEQVRDLYDAEVTYGQMLPSLVRKATSQALAGQLKASIQQTQDNASRLAEICEILGVSPTGITCEAMAGLVREAKGTTCDWGDTATIDAALIANAQRIVHYEIAGFGTARAFAICLDQKAVSRLLDEMLNQAFENDHALTRIATGGWFSAGVNDEAAAASA